LIGASQPKPVPEPFPPKEDFEPPHQGHRATASDRPAAVAVGADAEMDGRRICRLTPDAEIGVDVLRCIR
jgi:hypothetical protein